MADDKAVVVYGIWFRRPRRIERELVTLYESRADAEAHSREWHSVGHRTGDKLWIEEHALHQREERDRA